MDKLTSILVIAERKPSDRVLLAKAVELARAFGAVIELYMCDSEHAADLRRVYDTAGVEKEWLERVWAGREYLEALRGSVPSANVPLFVDCMCDSRVLEAMARKIEACHPHLVMKSASQAGPGRFALDAADWELMRVCPVSLMLIRERPWSRQPARFAAMVDMLDPERPSTTKEVLHVAEYLAVGCRANLDVVYCERDPSAPDRGLRAQELMGLAREHQVASHQVHVLSGDPDEVLPEFASRNRYDVVVLGALTHRRRLTHLVGRLVGRFAEAVECDLLLVKSSVEEPTLEAAKSRVLRPGASGG